MIKLIFITLLTISALFSYTLEKDYYVVSKEIRVSDIVSDVHDNRIIFSISKSRDRLRVKTSEVMGELKSLGYESSKPRHNYIRFMLESPIDKTDMVEFVREYYMQNYPLMKIKDVAVNPRSYVEYLSEDYELSLPKNSFKNSKGILNIRTENRKFFFDYKIDATINIYETTKKIRRANKITSLNSKAKVVKFDRFRALPISKKDINFIQTKNTIRVKTILTTRDITKLDLIKKGSRVSVTINNKNLAISFVAKALDSGKVGDNIRVQKSDGSRFKATVIGSNRVEIR